MRMTRFGRGVMIIRIARRIEIAGMCPPIGDLLGRDPSDPGNFLMVSDLESVFLRFPHQKIPDILSLSGCRKYPAVFFLRDSRDPVFFEKRDQFQVIVFIEAAADTAAFFPIPVDEILDGSAVGDVALAAAGHQKFRAGAACFLQYQAGWSISGRLAFVRVAGCGCCHARGSLLGWGGCPSLAASGRRIKSGTGEQAGCAGADDNAVVNHAGEFLSFRRGIAGRVRRAGRYLCLVRPVASRSRRDRFA